MASAIAEPPVIPTTVRNRIVDAVGRATHMTHEARLLKTLASDAVEDGLHAAKRAITLGTREVEDLRDAAAYRVKKAPLRSIAMAAGAGILVGLIVGRCGRRTTSRQTPKV
jgi:ElaB/YqjD/DUF883 family membrane-anchored ribosome-binding protein